MCGWQLRGSSRARPAGGDDRLGVLYLHTPLEAHLGADMWIQVQLIRAVDDVRFDRHVAYPTGPPGAPTAVAAALRDVGGIARFELSLGPPFSHRSRREQLQAAGLALRGLARVAVLAAYLRRHRLRVVHASDRPRDALLAVLLARLTGARSVVHVHQAYDPRGAGRPFSFAVRHADAVVGVSRFVTRTLVDHGVARERAHTIPNAVDVSRWRPGEGRTAARDELGAGAGTLVITTMARLLPNKGLDELLRAAAALRRDVPDVLVVVAGTTVAGAEWYERELRDLAHSLGLDDHVRFLGWRSDPERLLAASDIYAMPSHREPFGLVFAEAMAMELPVVGLDDGGTTEVVEADVTGLLSSFGDAEALAANLRRLAADPELRARLGAAGRRRVLDRFDVERLGRDAGALYLLLTSGIENAGGEERTHGRGL